MEEQRIGVYVCWCGTNIAKMVDVEAIAKELEKMPGVAIARDYKYMCSDPGQDMIIKDIKEHKLNRVVVAACSPMIHELTFRKALQNAGLNPYLFEMANIREHVSWVHTDREVATKKAKSLVAAAITRVNFHEALDKRTVDINPATLIIGGGICGLTAALEIGDSHKQVYLVEKSVKLGGKVANLDLTFPHLHSGKQLVAPLIKQVLDHDRIEVLPESEIETVSGYIGNFEAKIKTASKSEKEYKFGNIIVATGLKEFDATQIPEYQYKKIPNIVTSLEFEQMLLAGKIETITGEIPKNIAIIHCVGSRNKNYKEYCSRACCTTALKYANQIRSALPETNIFEIYADMRAFGKGCEEFYSETSRKGVMFLAFDKENLPRIKEAEADDNCRMVIEMEEILSAEEIEVPADLVVLMVGAVAQDDAKEVAHLVGISMCGNEFFIERHPKLDPVATTTAGVYIVGTCQSPKNIPDSIAQSKAACARVLATIEKGKVEVELTTAVVNEDICCGCQTCILVCPYTAVSFDEEKGVSIVNEVLCKGCGTCGSACPSGAIRSKHFTDLQIISQIEGLMAMEG